MLAADAVQYSSSGVREQTAELSSSFLSDSEISRHFSPDRGSMSTGVGQPRTHNTIEETSEPVSPAGSDPPPVKASEISKGLRKQALEDGPRSEDSGTSSPLVPEVVVTDGNEPEVGETTPLLPRERLPAYRKVRPEPDDDTEELSVRYKPSSWNRIGHHYPKLKGFRAKLQHAINPKTWDYRILAQKVIVEPVSMLPAVFLGLLLNLLDALSYGISTLR